jgi:hypothetical protein
VEPAIARAAWQRLEPIHAVTYFAPECRDAYKQLGLRGFWMGYFAGRAAPMGAVNAGVVEATFFNFHPVMIRRAIPGAWSIAPPAAIVETRSAAAAAALRRLTPGGRVCAPELVPMLRRVIEHTGSGGRALFAANRDVARPDDEMAELWQAATALREHRGDGHVAALSAAGVDGCEAHVLFAATEHVPAQLLRDNRGWSADDWEASTDRLRTRGLLDDASRPTDSGRALRREIEQRTDTLALPPYAALHDDDVSQLLLLAGQIATAVAASGVIPFPNPMGLPPVTSSRG